MKKKKKILILGVALLVGVTLLLLLGALPVHASGFMDDTGDASHLFSRYGISNYQLDFYVDMSGTWLPWNWGDGLGKSLTYGVYLFTNLLWTGSCYFAQGAGYIIQEVFQLDFIDTVSQSIGKNIQTLAGVSPSGISTDGFYYGMLLLLVLALGIYVLYVGAIRREMSKAISAVINFVVIFILSAVFIASAPAAISKINEFSRDMSEGSLQLGMKMMGEDAGTDGTKEGAAASIRDALWKIQVDVPWELLQFGSVDEISRDRVNGLKSISPDEEGGKTREDAVKEEVTKQNNENMGITKVTTRLGVTLMIFLMSVIITIFVFLLSGIYFLMQILFIVYAMYLPISFLLSMIPTFGGLSKRAVLSLFNTLIYRTGLTLMIVVTFSISFLLYKEVGTYPFFLIMFIQLVVFVGTFLALPQIMRMITLPTGEHSGGMVQRMVTAMVVRKGLSKMFSGLKKIGGGVGKSIKNDKASSGDLGNSAGRWHGRSLDNLNLETRENAEEKSKHSQDEKNMKERPGNAGNGSNTGKRPGSAGNRGNMKERPGSAGSRENMEERPGSVGNRGNMEERPGSTGNRRNTEEKPGSARDRRNMTERPGNAENGKNLDEKPGSSRDRENMKGRPGDFGAGKNLEEKPDNNRATDKRPDSARSRKNTAGRPGNMNNRKSTERQPENLGNRNREDRPNDREMGRKNDVRERQNVQPDNARGNLVQRGLSVKRAILPGRDDSNLEPAREIRQIKEKSREKKGGNE